jgi:hypothetical protein
VRALCGEVESFKSVKENAGIGNCASFALFSPSAGAFATIAGIHVFS